MINSYISKDIAKLRFAGWYHETYSDDEILKILDDIPAANVVKVVRCRECYFRELDGANVPVCTGAMAYSHTPDDWFCAAGKLKNGG